MNAKGLKAVGTELLSVPKSEFVKCFLAYLGNTFSALSNTLLKALLGFSVEGFQYPWKLN